MADQEQERRTEQRKKTLKQLPAALRAHLRNANIRDTDMESINVKLQERLSSNILSYLQLCILKLRPNFAVNVTSVWQSHDERNQYSAMLADSVSRSTA